MKGTTTNVSAKGLCPVWFALFLGTGKPPLRTTPMTRSQSEKIAWKKKL